MSNTYSQIHLHFVIAVKFRRRQISDDWKDSLYKYITGIIQAYGHKLLSINGMPDHVHILIGMRPTQSISELMQKTKSMSSKWINDQGLTTGKFEWQGGYAVFSLSKTEVPRVIQYIGNQEVHHSQQKFLEEYIHLLQQEDIEYDDRYLFTELE